MIVNILRFSFKDGTTDAEKDTVLSAMRRTASVESVAFSTVGQDIGDPAEGFTHTYLAAVADLPALERYMHDPVHLEGDWQILPHIQRMSAVRLSDDPDPELSAKVMALHLAKVAQYPDWGQALQTIPEARIANPAR
ncbi:Dabb family protein [Amycolatopsis magusensis]|uniref:Stress-response A/B barrel domain-containing protein n=1 Tax=Amycolatopsis magusensis TaxID=882444 RepID=A0ABS4PZ69_9PSEU|nr:Dabb family protein [Amycolatopsis magusensis]MBP2184724.1 hypothetical protein [Amycolatopsis magusensis]